MSEEPDRMAPPSGERIAALPLFPLHTVLFPQGRLALKVFETRYLDMVGQCLRDGTPFGVVQLNEGQEAGRDPLVRFDAGGTLALIDEVDAARPGILLLRCHGSQRFIADEPSCQPDGLWRADVQLLADDVAQPPKAGLEAAAALKRVADMLGARAAASAAASTADGAPAPTLPQPLRLDDAGWVANRWCELLPLPPPLRRHLLLLADPQRRLERIEALLRRYGVIDREGGSDDSNDGGSEHRGPAVH